MDQLLALQNAMFKVFGEDVVREIADGEEFCVDIFPDMLDDESTIEVFAEMVNFVVTALSGISEAKARSVLLSAQLPEDEIDDLLSDEYA